jgi:dUTP pyrophosphatase
MSALQTEAEVEHKEIILQTIKFKKTSPNAKTPTKANESDAGYDLYSLKPVNLRPGERQLVPTGIALEMPRKNMVGLIWPRSSLSAKYGIDVLAGVIDSGYTGEIMVCLLNTSTMEVSFAEETKIAQIIFQEHLTFDFQEVESLGTTDRGAKGFGSSDAT